MTENPAPATVPEGIAQVEANTKPVPPAKSDVLIITGMSGAGRTKASTVLEDLGWYVVDNLPPKMLIPLVDMMERAHADTQVAAVVDVRGGDFFNDLQEVLDLIRGRGIPYRILFLEASDEVLVRRFEQVRRPHPLQDGGRILDGISAERELLLPFKRRADVLINSSDLNVHDLAREVRAAVASGNPDTLRISVVAFGFKYGIPLDADHVVDMRFIANPYWITELRHLTGRDAPVRDYVLGRDGTQEFIRRYIHALEPVFMGYLKEEKRYLTIAIGCTGGKHRSVAVSEEIARLLRDQGFLVTVTARDLGKE